RKTITLTNSERLNAKSVEVNAHTKVNAYKLWAFTLSFHQKCANAGLRGVEEPLPVATIAARVPTVGARIAVLVENNQNNFYLFVAQLRGVLKPAGCCPP
ncbi:MAG: hypothetical protein IJI54_00300, partial [Kiritimatiellae bacterium]|nr:hypothetical protein [Kiritimatiellia bacterium]